jgi:isocitrate dehydrogenase
MTKDLAQLVKPEGLTDADYQTTEDFLQTLKVNLEAKLA